MSKMGINERRAAAEEVRKRKDANSVWESLQAPEFMSYWSTAKEWPNLFQKEFDVVLHEIHFNGGKTEDRDTARYSKKNPLYIDGAIVEKATHSTKTSHAAAITIGPENILQLNKIMAVYSKITNVTSWKVEYLQFHSDNELVEYRYFNPDGRPDADLFFHRVVNKSEETFFCDVLRSRQRELAKGFYDNREAHCRTIIKKKPQEVEVLHTCDLVHVH